MNSQLVLLLMVCSLIGGQNVTIGFHQAVFDETGLLQPWDAWFSVITNEINWYLKCPTGRKEYPIFIYNTFMDGDYKSTGESIIPAMQDGMGIISYLKYWEYIGRSDDRILQTAKLMADYIVQDTLISEDALYYPKFTRSSGINLFFPLETSGQADVILGADTIEPDKGGIAGYALLMMYNATQEEVYLNQAVQNAVVLAQNMKKGDSKRAPWPFRVNAKTGVTAGDKNGNMVYILRLFDALIDMGYTEFVEARDDLWNWIAKYQIPSTEDESLWVNFFEDQVHLEDNRNSWSPLEMARYLIEKKEKLDLDWETHAENLMQFALKLFGMQRIGNVTIMGEQDKDHKAWGGANSKLGGVATLFYCATGRTEYRTLGVQNLNWMTYFVDNDGCPAGLADGVDSTPTRGGWQEDCHTDVIHNFVDALNALEGKC